MKIFPTNKLEKALQRQGFELIAGVDEVGRGSWAGPIVAAAVVFKPGVKISGVADSKMLSEKTRRILFEKIIDQCEHWSAAAIGPQVIDLINIGRANLLVMEKAVKKLKPTPHIFLADGYGPTVNNIDSRVIKNGDQKVFSIAAASIIAKVLRDELMQQYHEQFPEYNFSSHKGYGTAVHRKMIKKYGICEIHRQSFEPIKSLIKRRTVV